MRIAIVDPYFAIDLGYQTTCWFGALVAQGHHVRAFSSCYVDEMVRHLYKEPFPEGLFELGGGEVLRLPARLLPRSMVLCTGPLLKELRAFVPDATLMVYPGTLFARDVIAHRKALPGSLFSAFGDNRAQRRIGRPGAGHSVKRVIVDASFFVLKRRFYRRCMEMSDAVLLHTPDTFSYLLPRISAGTRLERIRAKCALCPLGFDSGVFRADATARLDVRRRLAIADDEVVGLHSCRVEPEKRLGEWVAMMAGAMRRVPKLRAVLVGIRQGDGESQRVLSAVEASGFPDRFSCLPFASREELPRLYNAADFGVWHRQPSITIQEAMGTGLYMLLTDELTVSHLVADPETGRYFRAGDYARAEELVVETATAFLRGQPVARPVARRRRAELNARAFSYAELAKKLVTAAQDPPNAVRHLSSSWQDSSRAGNTQARAKA